jgi:hypothetical protein
MEIKIEPKAIGYSWPATGKMTMLFMESGGIEGVVLSPTFDRNQAHDMIRELTAFCRDAGHLLYLDLERPMRSITGVQSLERR